MTRSEINRLRIIYPHHLRFMARKAHEVLIMRTCHALATRGHEVHLVIGKCKEPKKRLLGYYGLPPCENLHIHQLPIFRMEGRIRLSWNTVFKYFCYKKIKELETNIAPDLVYLSELELSRYLQDKGIGIPMVYEIHGLYAKEYRYPNQSEKAVFTKSDLLITTTESLKNITRKLYPEAPQICKVPLAADMSEKRTSYTPPALGELCRVLYIGDTYPLQGLETAISALKKLPDRFLLDIVGGRKDEHKKALQNLISKMGLGKRIKIHGFIEPREIRSWLHESHILIAPCLAEKKMPYVAHTKIYEYLASGRPIVASDLPSIREVLEDGKNAVLFKPGNANMLGKCLEEIGNNPELAKKLAENAWNSAKKYTWELRAKKLVESFGYLAEK